MELGRLRSEGVAGPKTRVSDRHCQFTIWARSPDSAVLGAKGACATASGDFRWLWKPTELEADVPAMATSNDLHACPTCPRWRTRSSCLLLAQWWSRGKDRNWVESADAPATPDAPSARHAPAKDGGCRITIETARLAASMLLCGKAQPDSFSRIRRGAESAELLTELGGSSLRSRAYITLRSAPQDHHPDQRGQQRRREHGDLRSVEVGSCGECLTGDEQ